jgi:transcriptional regulator with GAF, ATPase, and Fis domain
MSRHGTVQQRINRHLDGLIAAALLGCVPFTEFENMLRRRVIKAALRRHDNCILKAAAELGIKRDNLRARMIRLGIPLPARSVAKSASNARRRAA